MRYLKNKIIYLLILLSTSNVAVAQDTVLALMKNKSDIVAHVKIVEIQGGMIGEVGVEEWATLCEIIQPIKGSIEKGGKVRFHFNRFVFQGKKEPFVVQKGKEYVVFLKGTVGKIRFSSDDKLEVSYSLVDRWVGILPYDYYLIERLTKYIE